MVSQSEWCYNQSAANERQTVVLTNDRFEIRLRIRAAGLDCRDQVGGVGGILTQYVIK